jgi:hypothetical protein
VTIADCELLLLTSTCVGPGINVNDYLAVIASRTPLK